jgi:hypothetical protein
MIVRYNPRNYFQGRIYAENHPEDCAVAGSNHGPTFLTLPVDPQRCGVNRAFDFESPNRTLIYVYIIIQQNPLVQMQSDRYIKVGCISYIKSMSDISLETSMAFNKKDFEGEGTLVIDRGFECPILNIYIVDPLTERLITEARIGQTLKFIISMESHFEHYDFRAINLTATSPYDHLDLINSYGCPIDNAIFPALQPEKTKNSRRLMTKFKAFKFANSPQIKFNVVIQFCYQNCILKNCGYGIVSQGRKKRQLSAEIVNKSPTQPQLDRIIFPDESTASPSTTLEPVKFPEPPQKLVNIRTDTFGNPLGIQQYFGNENELPNNDMSKNKIVTVPLDIILNVIETSTDDGGYVIGENDQILVGSLGNIDA